MKIQEPALRLFKLDELDYNSILSTGHKVIYRAPLSLVGALKSLGVLIDKRDLSLLVKYGRNRRMSRFLYYRSARLLHGIRGNISFLGVTKHYDYRTSYGFVWSSAKTDMIGGISN